MVYIRTKKLKGDSYLYLVKSVWDSKKNTSRQEIIKYLGKASETTKDDLPPEYRDDPKILSVMAANSPADIKKREVATDKTKKQIYKKFTEGDLQTALDIYEDFSKLFPPHDFLDKIIKPVMYKVGDDWANNKISVATEHVASNVAQSLVKIIMDRNQVICNKKKILICVPVGEEHHLGCDVIETFLASKGFKVFNMAVSAPTESIVNFIDNHNPDIIFVSITLEDNIRAAQRLVNKIKDEFKIPVLVGGLALQNPSTPKFNAQVIKDTSLDELPKIIRITK